MNILANISQIKNQISCIGIISYTILLYTSTTFGAEINTHIQSTPQNAPAVIEIFTSKYCPACPAGDRNFNRLIDKNPNIIALSCHVTYFNKNTRKDLLSKPFCDARQNLYRRTLKTGGIFTPMVVENGRSFTPGIKTEQIQKLGNKAQNNKNQLVGLYKKDQYLEINLPSAILDKSATVWLLEIEKQPRQNGYTHYRNNIKNITKLLNWNGEKLSMAFPISATNANTGYAILVHNAKGSIIAAGKTGF